MQLGKKFLEESGCPSGGDREIACLQALNATDMQHWEAKDDYKPRGTSALMMAMQWVPVIDPVQLPEQPFNALKNGRTAPGVPVLFGTVANESVQFIYDILKKPADVIETDLFIDFIFDWNSTLLTAIQNIYGDLPIWAKDERMNIAPLATDYVFYCPNRVVGRGLTAVTPTYMYMFDYVSPNYKWVYNKYMPYCDHVVCHADDLGFIFNPWRYMTEPHPPFMANETRLAHFVQHAWANFASSGNPNLPKALPEGIVWPQFDGSTNVIVNYSIPVSLLKGYRADVCDDWDVLGYDRF
jgi:carboxylesterase type B